MAGLSIKNKTRSALAGSPRSAFSAIAAHVLPGWEISLVFVGATLAKKLNKDLRGKTYVPNVLSYVVGEKSGEIFICLQEAKRQAPKHSMSVRDFTLYLFIHGVLHLNGRVHGATMEKWERTLLARYDSAHNDRNRHRHVPGKDGRRRGNLR